MQKCSYFKIVHKLITVTVAYMNTASVKIARVKTHYVHYTPTLEYLVLSSLICYLHPI